LISIEIDDKDPQFAADLANAHVQELQQLLARLAVTEAQQRRAFFEKQLSLVQAKMIAAEQALRATGVNSSVLKSNPTSAVAAVAALKAQVTAQEVKVGAMRGYLADTAPDFKQALNELSNLRAQLAKQEKDEPASAAGQGDYVAKYREFKYQETI
jgi:capsule polysaccharide export protein KpsE/RkpR